MPTIYYSPHVYGAIAFSPPQPQKRPESSADDASPQGSKAKKPKSKPTTNAEHSATGMPFLGQLSLSDPLSRKRPREGVDTVPRDVVRLLKSLLKMVNNVDLSSFPPT
jgi:hypothetical protein